MDMFLKPAVIATAVALFCAFGLVACATPGVSSINAALVSPKADDAAVRFETALAVMVTSLEVAASAPDSGINKAKMATAVRKAYSALDEARGVFDARSGKPDELVARAFAALDEAVPVSASGKARLALALGRGAASVFVRSLVVDGPPLQPSAELKTAREATDRAVEALLIKLEPPG